jgi:putative aldouronate transport system substrate-binding protein
LGTTRLFLLAAYAMGSGYGTRSGFGMYFEDDIEDPKWLYGPVHPEFKYVLSFFSKAYAEGVLDPDFAVTTPEQWHEKNSNGMSLFSWDNMNFGQRWNLALRKETPEAKWGPLETLEGPKGRRNYRYFGIPEGGFAMGATSEYPERIVELLDWSITPEGLDLTNWGIEGVHYRYVKGSRPATITDYTDEGLSRALDYRNKEILPDVWKAIAEKTDPFRAYQSETGTGLLDYHVLTDKGINYQWESLGEYAWWYEQTAKDPGLRLEPLTPPLTKDEADRVKEITAALDVIMLPAYDNIITGKIPLADYDGIVQQAIRAGALELEEIYNEAEARLK